LYDIKPIRNEMDHAAALGEVEHFWGARSGTPEGNRLELATLVAACEEGQVPMGPPDPIEAIEFRMGQQVSAHKDLEARIGRRTRIAEVLSRKHSVSIAMIRRLHTSLGIPAEVLSQVPRNSEAAWPGWQHDHFLRGTTLRWFLQPTSYKVIMWDILFKPPT